jgi:hypothetical protein
VTGLAVYLTIVIAFAALCCGHQGEDFPIPLRGAWRYLRAPHGPFRLPRHLRGAPEASGARTAPSAPPWANTQPIKEN